MIRGKKTKKGSFRLILLLLIILLFLSASSIVSAIEDDAYNCLDVTLEFDEDNGTIFVPSTLYLGEADGATDGPPADSYDVPTPPNPPTSFISVWFDDGLPRPYDKLYKDYRSYPDIYKSWNLSIHWVPSSSSPPTTITILWDPNQINNCEYDNVDLWDATQIVADMKLDSSYSFTAENYVIYNFWIIARIVEEPDETNNDSDDGNQSDVPADSEDNETDENDSSEDTSDEDDEDDGDDHKDEKCHKNKKRCRKDKEKSSHQKKIKNKIKESNDKSTVNKFREINHRGKDDRYDRDDRED